MPEHDGAFLGGREVYKIVVSAEDAERIRNRTENVVVVGPDGKSLGVISPEWTEAEVQEVIRRSKEPNRQYHSTRQVLDHLKSLDHQ